MDTPTNEVLKEREHQSWHSVAAGWRRQDALLRRCFGAASERMLDLGRVGAGHSVLDIASGTGEPAIPAARRVGPEGRVIGTDLVDDMLAVARDKAASEGLENIEFRCVDGEMLALPEQSFDVATIRWGLMFMPDPEACLRGIHPLLKDTGRVVCACWSAPEENPFVGFAMGVLKEYMEVPQPKEGMPGIFAFANPDRLRTVLESSGFHDVVIESLELAAFDVRDGAQYLSSLKDMAGPLVVLMNQLDAKTREAFEQDVVERANKQRSGGKVSMKGTTWIAVANKERIFKETLINSKIPSLRA